MIKIGDYNSLKVVKKVDFGIYLDGGNSGEILMPKKYVPKGTQAGDTVEAFIYPDSEDRLIATTETPKAKVNEFASLKVKSVNKFGAFLDWGILKDLLVPFKEQKVSMEEGNYYVVYIYLDEQTNRLAASAKIDKYLHSGTPPFAEDQEVSILIQSKTDIGYKAIIENEYIGLLYENEVFRDIKKGDRLTAYVKKIRHDDKIDLALQKSGYEQIDSISKNILQKIKEEGGFIAVNDKSSPEQIKDLFNISKKSFKKAIGTLYRQHLILIEEEGIRLNKEY
jgi:predicted RNA-binding protein (virulence factor B family)